MVYTPDPDTQENSDVRTMRVLSEIANSIDGHIQTTYDCPSLKTSGRMPVLDLCIWVSINKVQHSFYQKPMASPYIIKYDSALSSKSKRQALVQEGLRHLQNMGPGVPEEERHHVMSKMMNAMLLSGYNQRFRLEILKGIQN